MRQDLVGVVFAAFLASAFAEASFAEAAFAEDAPPQVKEAIAQLDQQLPCSRMLTSEAPDRSRKKSELAPPRAISTCARAMPEAWVNLLTRKQVAFSCGSLFDIGDDGAARNVQTLCDVAGRNGPVGHDWRIFLETMMGTYVYRDTANLQYEPKTANKADIRKDVFVYSNFNFDGPDNMPPIHPFARTAVKQ